MKHKEIISKRGRGRPRSSRITIQIRLLPEVDAAIELRAKRFGISKGQYIERLVLSDDPAFQHRVIKE